MHSGNHGVPSWRLDVTHLGGTVFCIEAPRMLAARCHPRGGSYFEDLSSRLPETALIRGRSLKASNIIGLTSMIELTSRG